MPRPEPVGDLRGHCVVYGGSFDPPHVGHQMACLYLLEGLGADAVWLVPVGSHAFGKSLSPAADRLAMVEAMAAPLGTRVRVCTAELDRAGPSRSIDTLAALRGAHPTLRFALAVGADLWGELSSWAQADALFANTPVALLGRAGVPMPDVAQKVPYVALPDVQSRVVRARCQAGQSVVGLVPTRVRQIIAARGLYAATQDPSIG